MQGLMMSQGNVTNTYQQERLIVLNDELATLNITTIVIIAILMVIGLVGNSVACYIFSFRLRMCTQHFLIVWLAVFDLLSCSVAMPAEIVDIRYFIMYPDETACRLLRFVNHFCSFASILTLIVISVDRFRKVCRPLKQQMRPKHSKLAMAAVLVVGVAYALPAPFVYGIQTIKTREAGVHGYDCSTSDKVKGTLLPLLYNAALFLTFLVIFVVLTVIYVKIWREMKRHIRYMAQFSSLAKDSLKPEALSTDSTTTSSGQFYEPAGKPGGQSGLSARFRAAADKRVPAHRAASVTDTESLTDAEESSPENRSSVGVKQSEQRAPKLTSAAGTEAGANAGSLIEYPLQNTDGSRTSGHLVDVPENTSVRLVSEANAGPLLHPPFQDGGTSEPGAIMSTKGNPASFQQCSAIHAKAETSNQDPRQVSDLQREEGEQLLQLEPASKSATISPAASIIPRDQRGSESDSPARKISRSKSTGSGRGAVKTHKATVIAMSVTAVFFLSFLPHLSLVTARVIRPDFEAGLQGVSLVAFNIFLRSYFINCVANPIIYGVLNQAFRAQCLSLVHKLCSCRK